MMSDGRGNISQYLKKLEDFDSSERNALRERFWLTDDTNALKLLENGAEQFYANAAKRVLSDNPDKTFLNFCPKCGRLARTPEAKQCPQCYFSWHY